MIKTPWLWVGLLILYNVTIPPAVASNTTNENLIISVCNLISSLVLSAVIRYIYRLA